MSRENHVQVITSAPLLLPDFAECWRSRGLLWMFIRRNIKVRYTQTLLGSTWIVIQPLLLAGMLTVVMGAILGAPSGDIPYPLFAFTGSAIPSRPASLPSIVAKIAVVPSARSRSAWLSSGLMSTPCSLIRRAPPSTTR